MMETWYVMEDGTCGDPREIVPDAGGVLRHKDGRAVAYADHGPLSRGVDPDEELAKAKKPAAPSVKDMKPAAEPKQVYTTRESKAD